MINRADVHITYNCNLSCPGCNRGCFTKLKQAPDMNLEIFEKFLSDSKKLNMEYDILLVGGEPTLHKDLLEFIKLTTESGRKSLIHTNAYSQKSKEILEEVKKTSCEVPSVGFTDYGNKYFYNDTFFISPADMGFKRNGPCEIYYTCGGFSVDSLGYTPCSHGGMIANFICPSVRTTNLADLLDEKYIKFALDELCKHCGATYRFAGSGNPPELEKLFASGSLEEVWTKFINSTDMNCLPEDKLYEFPSKDGGTTKMTKTWWNAIINKKEKYVTSPITFPNRDIMANELFTNKIGIEIGVYEGAYAETILSCNPTKLYLLDCWEHQTGEYQRDPANDQDLNGIYQLVLSKFKHNPNVEIVKKYSQDFVKEIPDEYFDFIYLDANHTYDAVLQDLKAWYPKVKKGGIFAGHDYFTLDCIPWVEVKPALLKFFNREPDYITLEKTPLTWGFNCCPSWAFKAI